MSKRILKPNKVVGKINIDEIEIKTDIKKIIVGEIPNFIILVLLTLCVGTCLPGFGSDFCRV